ncbi:MAG: glycosyltransferase [Planctomycetota bacterium]
MRDCDITVVLPVFNAESTIRRSINSILHQTLRPSEVVVVDDGSTDQTVSEVNSINDGRVRLVAKSHEGVAAAANAAAKVATSPLIARMDADDYSHPTRLEKQWHLLQDNALDAVGCQVQVTDVNGNASPTLDRYAKWINEETLIGDQISALRFVELPMVNPTILARREYFELGFRDNGLPEDYDLMLRAAAAGMKFGKVAEVLFDWTDRPGRLTRTSDCFSPAAFARCRQIHLLAGPLANVDCVDLWGVGKTGKPWLLWLQQNGIRVRRAYDISPRKVGTIIHDVEVYHPDELQCDGTMIVIAVGAENARRMIIPQLVECGFQLGCDAWFVA